MRIRTVNSLIVTYNNETILSPTSHFLALFQTQKGSQLPEKSASLNSGSQLFF